jgi:hypothetical protein
MTVERATESDLVPDGITAGIVAGAVMLVAVMLASMDWGGNLESSLRLASSVALGPAALSHAYPFLTAAVIGAGLHFILSAVYGVAYFSLLGWSGRIDAGAVRLLLYGAAFGAIPWVVNVQILGAIVFPQFIVVSPFWIGAIAHVVFFGLVLGAYAALIRPGRTTASDGRGTP